MDLQPSTLFGPRHTFEFSDEGYPELLRSIPRPPKKLYVLGNPQAILPGVAVVGARKATPYGLACARRFAGHAASRGLTIVSGGARGCDQEAHSAALEAGGNTVVVFASGPDVAYPRGGTKLFQQVIDEGGAIVSENPFGFPPLKNCFPQRNRIIAGLSLLLLIVEAGLPSGTFSTADAALAAGREVAAVPGSISSPESRGSNRLIAQGAALVADEESLDSALDMAFEGRPLSMLPPDGVYSRDLASKVGEDKILHALAARPYSLGELADYYGFSAPVLLSTLSHYEMEGMVERGRDGRYQVVP